MSHINVLHFEHSGDDAARILHELQCGEIYPNVTHVTCWESLTQSLRSQSWDLLISDHQPGEDSVHDLLLEIKRLKLDLPVIIVSAPVPDEEMVKILHLGAHDYIFKNNLSRLNPVIEREIHETAIHREYIRSEKALIASEHSFMQVSEILQEIFWLVDCESQQLIYLSPTFEEVWEQPGKSFSADINHFLNYIHPDDYDLIAQKLTQGWSQFNAEYRIQTSSGRTRWISTRSFPVEQSDGQPNQVACISSDITQRRILEDRTQMLSRALEQSADAVMISDPGGIIEYVNEAFEKITGFCKEDAIGQPVSILKSGMQNRSFYEKMWKNLNEGLPFSDIFINRKKDGSIYFEAKTIAPVRDENGDVTHFISTGKDITERIKAKDRLHQIIHYDSVTGVANRVLLTERIERAIIQSDVLNNQFALLRIGFTLSDLLSGLHVNQLFEKMMAQIANRLESHISPQSTVARIGHEEFAILLVDIDQPALAMEKGAEIIASFNDAVMTQGYELIVVPRIGISIYPEDGDGVESLLLNAKLALNQNHEAQIVAYAQTKQVSD